MKKVLFLGFLFVFMLMPNVQGAVLKVGPGQPYTTIQSAINAAVTGDTVKVLPGTYTESITINKDIVVQGSGYETTKILTNISPAVVMNGGKIMWFSITSTSGDGIQNTKGFITNCVIAGCGRYGVYFLQNSTGSIKNSVIIGNASDGVRGDYYSGNNSGTASNCISWNNGGYGYYLIGGVTFSDGTTISVPSRSNVINEDPMFVGDNDFHIPPTSPCFDTGNPVEVDPDGSRSDMGYFGGIDTPVYPIVIEVNVRPLPNGHTEIKATARANY